MDVTAEQLFAKIGVLVVENDMLRMQIEGLQKQNVTEKKETDKPITKVQT